MAGFFRAVLIPCLLSAVLLLPAAAGANGGGEEDLMPTRDLPSEGEAAPPPAGNEIIVGLAPDGTLVGHLPSDGDGEATRGSLATLAARLSAIAGVEFEVVRRASGANLLLSPRNPAGVSEADLARALERLEASPEITFAQLNRVFRAHPAEPDPPDGEDPQ